jgi:squalene-associated FAD-dependent desaturase
VKPAVRAGRLLQAHGEGLSLNPKERFRVAVVGAGWAGMAAAVAVADAGADVTVFEASRSLGGRARALSALRPDGMPLVLDNGQHILIGAYSETLALMQRLGLDLGACLLRLPLGLPYPDGSGLKTPAWAARWPAPLDALAAIGTARGWTWGDRWALMRASIDWRRKGFECAPHLTVAELCAHLPQRVVEELIEPLCVSALNTPGSQASASVFLRVMRDALFGPGHAGLGASNLLLPRADLSTLMPNAAERWLQSNHAASARLRQGARVLSLQRQAAGWRLQGLQDGLPWEETYDRVVWATAAGPAAQAMGEAAEMAREARDQSTAESLLAWVQPAVTLAYTAITTVYAWAPDARLGSPMLALRAAPEAPAQFVFDRGQLCLGDAAAQGVLAFVVSASVGERECVQAAVLRQAAHQLGLTQLQPLQTVVEKRATFACTPGLQRPPMAIAPGLWAAGDYVDGPYPATLEGAVRSGLAAAGLALAA